MRVTMTHRIGGHRNLEPWPDKGEEIDLPVVEALDLIAAGYATATDPHQALAIALGVTPDTAPAVSGPAVPDLKKAKKPELVTFVEARGLDVDVTLGVRELRKAITHALEELDAPNPNEPNGEPSGATTGSPGGYEPDEPPRLEDLDKGQLLDIAADLNISVNPALSEEEIRAALGAASVVYYSADGTWDAPPFGVDEGIQD